MHSAHIGDHADLGLGNPAQEGDLAGIIKSHFRDHHLVTSAQIEQRKRQADLIVIVARIFVGMEAPAEHLRGEFLGGGFPHAAGDADDSQVQLIAPKPGDFLQGFERIFHPNAERRFGQGDFTDGIGLADVDHPQAVINFFMDEGNLRAFIKSRLDEAVAIRLFTLQRNKQRARYGFAGIDHGFGDD